LLPPIQKYAVFLKLTQDGKLLGTVTESGETSLSTLPLDLTAVIVPQEDQ